MLCYTYYVKLGYFQANIKRMCMKTILYRLIIFSNNNYVLFAVVMAGCKNKKKKSIQISIKNIK